MQILANGDRRNDIPYKRNETNIKNKNSNVKRNAIIYG